MTVAVPASPLQSLVTRHVYSRGRHVAMIVQQSKLADGYVAYAPWMLLHDKGRIDRFATYADAREEAMKSWPAASISRT